MEMGKNKTKIVKFVHVMIILNYIILFAMIIDAGNRCFQDSDCPQNMCSPPFKPGCFYGWCVPELILE
ncbi:unnamed protein product [Trifolium pratense]|uniref:Uncharacterized protein n=1 Tax=Trifolium pratense TaxID=57577 RepID=A0ACB0J8P6_TRIPR|nr:unnamed protein product [Trifolium pratense]